MNGHTAAHNVQAVVSTNVPVIYPMPGPPVFQFFRRIMRMVFKTIREDERVDPADIPRLFGRTAVEDSMRLDLDNFILSLWDRCMASGIHPGQIDPRLDLRRTRLFVNRVMWQWRIRYNILRDGEVKRMSKRSIGVPSQLLHPELGFDDEEPGLSD